MLASGLRNQGSGSVELLRGGCAGFRETGIPAQIEPGVVELSLVLELVGFRLGQRRFKRRPVNLDQDIPGVDIPALFEPDFDDLTVDPRSDEHAVKRLNRPQTAQVNRNIRAPRLVGHDRDGLARYPARPIARSTIPTSECRLKRWRLRRQAGL